MTGMTEPTRGSLAIGDFVLECGATLPAVIAYETLGALNPGGDNAVLLAHGYASSHRMMGEGGTWHDLVGPGMAIDTNRLFVVSSNMLGSSYGSTGPGGVNPATGRPWGPDFPPLSLVDIVRAQRALLERLGVRRVLAVAGPSFGGQVAFQWGVSFPGLVDGIIAVTCAPGGRGDAELLDDLAIAFRGAPNWRGGDYYGHGGVQQALVAYRLRMLDDYGFDDWLAGKQADPDKRRRAAIRAAEHWAAEFDANSLFVLRRASVAADTPRQLHRLKARVLYALCPTDRIYPVSLGADVRASLRKVGVEAEYFEIDSPYGHLAAMFDARKLAGPIGGFLERLMDGRVHAAGGR